MSQLRRILVPTDFSEFSESAVDYACELAIDSDKSRSEVHLIHVVSDTPGGGMQEAKLRSQLDSLGESIATKTELEHETVTRILPGIPSQVITDYAHEHAIDMIVMGTHGRTGLSHFALGSVAERVVRSSACPVLVVGPGTRAMANTS